MGDVRKLWIPGPAGKLEAALRVANPARAAAVLAHPHPLHIDSRPPKIPLAEFAKGEARFAMLERSDPARAAQLIALAQADADERFHLYQQMSRLERSVPVDRSRVAGSPSASGGTPGEED